MLLVVMLGVNLKRSFYIISEEESELKFRRWSNAHRKFKNKLFIFKVLASADIATLYILNSNLAGSSFFRIPFSYNAKSNIFWSVFLSIITGDIPQAIIQVGI